MQDAQQHNALCDALCTMHYALCTMHYALCTMHYVLPQVSQKKFHQRGQLKAVVLCLDTGEGGGHLEGGEMDGWLIVGG